MDKLVSICVPTYNQEKEIRDTLEGILIQEFDDYEIIIANDASTDNTESVCLEYRNKYPDKIRYISQQSNKGIIGNTQDCLLAANGRYIAICEGDDYWVDPKKLSKQVEILESNDDVSLVHTAWIDYYTNSAQFCKVPIVGSDFISEKEKGKRSFEEVILQKHRGIRFSSVLFRTDIFKMAIKKHSLFFDENFTTIDINVFYVMAFYGKLSYIPEYTTVYRIHDGSVSVNKNEHKQAKYSLGVLTANAYFCKEFSSSKKIINIVFRNSLRGLCPYVLKYQDIEIRSKIIELVNKFGYNLRIGQKLCLKGAKNKVLRFIAVNIINIGAYFKHCQHN